MQHLTLAQWLATVSQPGFANPPMPVYDVNLMSEADQEAVYAFMRSLGPAGQPAPTDVPPGQVPKTPYIPFAPVTPGGAGQGEMPVGQPHPPACPAPGAVTSALDAALQPTHPAEGNETVFWIPFLWLDSCRN